MNLKIKNYIFVYKVIDEDKKVVAKIKSVHFWSAAKKIIDIKGDTVYITGIKNSKTDDNSHPHDENRRFVIYQGQCAIATALLSYAKNDGKKSVQPLIFRPPQADGLDIQTHYGELSIKRQKDHSFVIRVNNADVGSITSLFPFKRHYISCAAIENSAFLAALYVLVMYTVNADNFIIF